MIESIQCYLSCIVRSGYVNVFYALIAAAVISGGAFFYTRKFAFMFTSQAFSIVTIAFSLQQMTCSMAIYGVGYISLMIGSIMAMGMVHFAMATNLRKLDTADVGVIRKIEEELDSKIVLLDTQKVKAFTFKKDIHLSVGLCEFLEPQEIKAVAAHELYHKKYTPNRYLASFLAFASMWFKSYRDEYEADLFAAEIAGAENLISALKKLDTRDFEKRQRNLLTRAFKRAG